MIRICQMNSNYEEYLSDESRMQGEADSISFPENEEEIRSVIESIKQEKMTVTIQGGKTGIVGGAVAKSGHIMNLSRMNHFLRQEKLDDGTIVVTVEAGMTLMELTKQIGRIKGEGPLFWPPNPTETSASIGGIAAVNAKGPNQILYGDAKKYIYGIKMIDSSGRSFEYTRKNEEKELVSILGTEGICGVISEVTLTLKPKPDQVWGIGFFFETDENAADFAEKLKNAGSTIRKNIASAEYLDRKTIELIEEKKSFMTKIKDLPDVSPEFANIILLELHGTEDEIEDTAQWLMEEASECGADPDKAWAVSTETEAEKFQSLRHAAAETVNLKIEELRRKAPGIIKLSTDFSLSKGDFKEVLIAAKEEIKDIGLTAAFFGHIFENHLHVNILPVNLEEYQKGQKVIENWVEKSGISPVMEHGVGKLKNQLFHQYGDRSFITLCRQLKEKYDPTYLFNPGNIL